MQVERSPEDIKLPLAKICLPEQVLEEELRRAALRVVHPIIDKFLRMDLPGVLTCPRRPDLYL